MAKKSCVDKKPATLKFFVRNVSMRQTNINTTKSQPNKHPERINNKNNNFSLFLNKYKQTKLSTKNNTQKITINKKIIISKNNKKNNIKKSDFKLEKFFCKNDMASNFTILANNINLTPSKPEEVTLAAQAQASEVGFEEINKLIKKLTLSFSSKKQESSFFVKDGIFEGARFQVSCENKQAHLGVKYLAPDAHQLLVTHQDYLRQRLLQKEINLESLTFHS